MANEQNLRSWQPGQSGNIRGRPKLPPELRRMMLNQRELVIASVCKILAMKKNDVLKLEFSCESYLEYLIAKVATKAAAESDISRLKYLLEHVIGKPTDLEEPYNYDSKWHFEI